MRNPQSDLFLLLAILFLALFTLHGCSEPSVIYKEKLVPIKCKIDKTPKPTKTGKLSIDVRNIYIYTEILEKDIETCTEGESK